MHILVENRALKTFQNRLLYKINTLFLPRVLIIMYQSSTCIVCYKYVAGVQICEKTDLTINSTAQTFQWEGFGLAVRVQENSLPPHTEQISLYIAASTAGQYEFPENTHLVSAVYWFLCEPNCKFEREVAVEIQHCAKSKNALKLKFVRADCTQAQLPFKFQYLEGGQFTTDSCCGIIKLKQFSAIAIVQDQSEEREYYASVFYFTPNITTREIHFVVTFNTVAHLTVSPLSHGINYIM